MASTIAIDARKILDFGIGTYIRNLIPELAKLDSENRYVLLVPNTQTADSALQNLPDNFSTVVESAPVYSLREFTAVSRTLRRIGADIYHATHYVLPLRLPCPAVVTIHDLIHLLFPEFLPNRRALLYARAVLRRAGRVAQRVIAVSECTAKDLEQHLNIPRERIELIWNGVNDEFRSNFRGDFRGDFRGKTNAGQVHDVLEQHGITAGFLLFVGNPKPHKNLVGVLQSYARAMHLDNTIPNLVCVGAATEAEDIRQQAEALGIASQTQVLGFVEQEHLPVLYGAATMLVCPGLYEGFGLPVAEAMASGTPVITSNISALAEVAGDAAILVDPRDNEQIAHAIVNLINSPADQGRLSALGKERSLKFQWSTAAQQTLAVYQRILATAEGTGQ